MRKLLPVIAVMIPFLPLTARAQQSTTTSRVVNAADAFLASLDADQRQHVLYPFTDNEQRARWSNFPTGVVPRGGISFKQMSEPQRDAAMKLLAVVLSPMGLEKVNQIRQADDDFKANGSKRGRGGRGPGGPPPGGQNGPPPGGRNGRGPRSPSGGDMFGSDLYYFSFLGKPSITDPWMFQFGGHHLALNITIAGSKGVLTPTLTGAQPASFKLNGKTIRPLGRESDKALALLQSLDEKQRQQAVLNYQVSDLVLGPGQDGKKIAAEGLKASSMNEKQQAMLLDIIAEWAGILNDTSATARMAEMKADLNQTWFAWSGPASAEPGTNITAYYRVQGPHLVIEYAPQRDEPTDHVHTMYRDPANDYGSALQKQ
ncbi:MAG TPA: DUF3500 domain-containing protein [Bryobacteraceae bacterium]|jgi:hypothetical protein|nr:DUF3500 domain-containing protein [Bryobacteraceae bacterium]